MYVDVAGAEEKVVDWKKKYMESSRQFDSKESPSPVTRAYSESEAKREYVA